MGEWVANGDLLEVIKVTSQILAEEPSLSGEPFRLACLVQERLPSSVRRLFDEGVAGSLPTGEPVQVTTTRDLLEKVQEALKKGLGVRSADEPYRRFIGYQVFKGETATQYLHIGLTHIKESNKPSQLEGFGVEAEVLCEAMKGPGGRVAIIDMLGGMSAKTAFDKLAKG